jgi:hypothetical protein
VNDSTKTEGSGVGTPPAQWIGMDRRDELIMRHTDACMAQMALEQAMQRLHRLGYEAEYTTLANVWATVSTERRSVADKLFQKQKLRSVK